MEEGSEVTAGFVRDPALCPSHGPCACTGRCLRWDDGRGVVKDAATERLIQRIDRLIELLEEREARGVR